MKITEADVQRALLDTTKRDKTRPRAHRVSYDQTRKRIIINLVNGCTLLLPPQLLQGLDHATPSQLSDVRICDNGNDIRWSALDVQFSVEGLANGIFGTPEWIRHAADSVARKAGQSKPPAKVAAARADGRKGGRPGPVPLTSSRA